MIRYSFTVQERLKKEQNIKTLFQTGKAYSLFPLKIIWLQLPRGEELSSARIAISVPKKRTPSAVNRNRIKRLIREAWRLNKHIFYQNVNEQFQVHLFFIFVGQPQPTFREIEISLQKAITQLIGNINPTANA